MKFQEDDGGRAAAGYKGMTGDCFVRAVAIAAQRPYQEIYDLVNQIGKGEYISKRKKSKSSARTGVHRYTSTKVMDRLGWIWTPTMFIGSGCRVHLREDELPAGRLVVMVSKHCTAVVDHVIRDLYNPDRGGDRCVYGYYSKS